MSSFSPHCDLQYSSITTYVCKCLLHVRRYSFHILCSAPCLCTLGPRITFANVCWAALFNQVHKPCLHFGVLLRVMHALCLHRTGTCPWCSCYSQCSACKFGDIGGPMSQLVVAHVLKHGILEPSLDHPRLLHLKWRPISNPPTPI